MSGRAIVCGLALGSIADCAAAAARPATPAVVVHADVAASRCAEASVPAMPPGARVEARDVRATAAADVVIGDDGTLGRGLESGELVEATAIELGDVPWVLVSHGRAPPAWEDLERLQPEVWVLGGPGGEAARKALQRLDPSRVHATRDLAALARAPLALVPASLAGGGDSRPTPVEPLRMRAVLTRRAASSPLAKAVLHALDGAALRQCLGAR